VLCTRNSISASPGNAPPAGGPGGGGCGSCGNRVVHEERKIISTTCRDECPAGSEPRGRPGGGDGGTEAGFVFLTGFGLGFFLERSELDMGLDFDGATFLRASPVLAQPERGRSLLGTGAPLAATSSTAMDLHCRYRTQLPIQGHVTQGGGLHRPTRPPASGYGRAVLASQGVKCAAESLDPYPCRKTPTVLYIPSALVF
jgi:hypothetical protein